MGYNYSSVFDAIHRLDTDHFASTPLVLIEAAQEYGWLTEWEIGFATDTYRKHRNSLSYKQLGVRERINKKLLQLLGKRFGVLT
jgi:hypothetical protein